MNKKTQGFRLLFELIILIILANVFSILWFNNMVLNELESSAKETMSSMVEEEKHVISLVTQNIEERLFSINNIIQHIGEDQAALLEYLELWKLSYNFETITLTELSGVAISSETGVTDISKYDVMHLVSSGNIEVTDIYKTGKDDIEVIAIYYPLIYEGAVEGAIIVEYSVEYLSSLLINSTDNRGASMIVNSSGDIILHTYPFDISFENFMQADFEEGKSYESVLNDFRHSIPGQVTFTIMGDKKIGEYLPVGINDWSLFFEISESNLSESAKPIINSMTVISIVLSVTFSTLLIYILLLRRNSLKNIETVAYKDRMTGVSNLVKFKIDLAEIFENNNLDLSKYALLKLDIENFKAINEVFGFDTGNKVICKTADILSEIKGDIFELARIGTDEFIIFTENQVIEDFLSQQNLLSDGIKKDIPEIKKHLFTFRYGRYFVEPEELNVDEMVNKVSMAHSFAKSQAGTLIWDYDEKFKQHLIELTEITNKMKGSLINNEFKLYLQPKYNMTDEKIVGAEALVRWIEPDGNMIYPGEFIPLFEKNKFIVELDIYMFRSACMFLKKRIQNNQQVIPISINFSRLHLENPNFVQQLINIALTFDVPTNYIEIELTETTVIEHQDKLSGILSQLKSAGFHVSIDDFGSGYSSLGMLKEFIFDVVKLDRSFFTSINSDDLSDIVVEGIISLVHSLGSTIVAEGIETKEQIDILKEINCDIVQGYYYSRPINTNDFEKLLDNQ